MSISDAFLLGIVEGITEFLPISSTGHLILASDLLSLPESDFLKTFQIVIQLGAIGAITALYWKKILFDREVMKRVGVALLPALGVGFLFYNSIRALFESSLTVVGALFIGGIILILFEIWNERRARERVGLEQLSYGTALGIGFFQALSVIPGVSRAGATILGGLMFGLKRGAVVEFSFLLAVPTMLAATTLDLWKHKHLFSSTELLPLLVGFFTAFGVAVFAVKFLLRYVETHTFIVFGIYRILLATIFFFFFL